MKQQLVQQMMEIVSKLHVGDKTRACKDIPISEPTLNKYLSGDIKKFDTAEKIINYFKTIQS